MKRTDPDRTLGDGLSVLPRRSFEALVMFATLAPLQQPKFSPMGTPTKVPLLFLPEAQSYS